eukprot:4263665-Pyramimonas_sp.AAC.1
MGCMSSSEKRGREEKLGGASPSEEPQKEDSNGSRKHIGKNDHFVSKKKSVEIQESLKQRSNGVLQNLVNQNGQVSHRHPSIYSVPRARACAFRMVCVLFGCGSSLNLKFVEEELENLTSFSVTGPSCS